VKSSCWPIVNKQSDSSGEVGDLYIKGGSFFFADFLFQYLLTTLVLSMKDIFLLLCFISYVAYRPEEIYKMGTRKTSGIGD